MLVSCCRIATCVSACSRGVAANQRSEAGERHGLCGELRGLRGNAAVSHGNAQGFRVFRVGKREENGGVGRQLGRKPDKVCMPCLFGMVLLRHKWGGYSEIPFFGGRGRWQRVVRSIASCQRSSAKSALWRSWFLLLRGLMGGVFSSMRAPAFEVHADEVVAAELV